MTLKEGIRAALGLLDRRDQRLLGLAMVIGVATSLLDLVGIVLLGGVGALAFSSIAGHAPPEAVNRATASVGLGGLSTNATIATLACAASLLLVAKSVVSPILLWRSLRFLARREAIVSARLTRELLSRPQTFIQQRSSQETTSALVYGVNAATIVLLGQLISASSEIALLTVLAILLLVANPVLALGVIVFFGLVGVGLQLVLGDRVARFAGRRRSADVASAVAVQEAVGIYREITVANRRVLYVDRLQSLRTEGADASAGSQFVNALPKFIAELALVFGAFALAAVLFATEPVAVAAGTFSIFLAAATRVMPSVLRLQSATLAIRSGAASAAPTFQLAKDLGNPVDMTRRDSVPEAIGMALSRDYTSFNAGIGLRDVTFSYAGSATRAIRDVSLTVHPGQSIALVGRSGAGKSTLADVILGILQPQSGEVTIGGLPPADAIQRWPGAVAYVPQDVFLTSGSVRANVALGIPREYVDDQSVWDALRRARLADYLGGQPDGLDSRVGERGLRLSGGQRQRLGLARALFTAPRLIVLDEATSALDAETELAITETLEGLDTGVTRVIIAHRLSTIRHVDVVVYLDQGRILATGTFDEVCNRVPALQRQATLMGLRPG